jgi:nitrite reductase (NO-forming)
MRNNPRPCLRATASLLALSLVLGAGLGLAASATSAVADGDGHGGAMAPHVQMEGIADIVRAPTDLPPPIGKRGPEHVRVDLETTEVAGQLDDGTSYRYWTFGGKVPGPFVRVRVGDTVEVHLKNAGDSAMMHNVDFHAVTGPGGGAAAKMAVPGTAQGVKFQAVQPGL